MSLAQISELLKNENKVWQRTPEIFHLIESSDVIFNIHLTEWDSLHHPHVKKCICSEKWACSTEAQACEHLKTTQHRDFCSSAVLMLSERLIIVTRIEISVRKSALLPWLTHYLLSFNFCFHTRSSVLNGSNSGLSGEMNDPGNQFFLLLFSLFCSVLMEVCSYGHTECISFTASFSHTSQASFTRDFSSSLRDPDIAQQPFDYSTSSADLLTKIDHRTNSWHTFCHKSSVARLCKESQLCDLCRTA